MRRPPALSRTHRPSTPAPLTPPTARRPSARPAARPRSGQGREFQYTDARGPAFRDDFSLLKCTRARPRVARRNLLLEACGRAVEEQVAAAGEAACGADGARHCARCGGDFKVDILYTGWPLRCGAGPPGIPAGLCARRSLVDAAGARLCAAATPRPHPHPPPLHCRSKLVQQYVASGAAPGRAPAQFAKPSGGSQLAAFRPKHEAWQRGWQEFHAQHAQLEPVCKHCATHRERQAGSLGPPPTQKRAPRAQRNVLQPRRPQDAQDA